MSNDDLEVKALSSVFSALSSLTDAEAQKRVLEWAWSKFIGGSAIGKTGVQKPVLIANPTGSSESPTEIPGVACLTPEGDLKITARDLKARSALDAAVRLAHVVLYAHWKLKSEQSISSSKVLVPIMKDWRLYDGNTRTALKKQKGIVRSGDNLSLDTHAKADAEKFVNQIRDSNLVGKWTPSAVGKKKGRKSADNSIASE